MRNNVTIIFTVNTLQKRRILSGINFFSTLLPMVNGLKRIVRRTTGIVAAKSYDTRRSFHRFAIGFRLVALKALGKMRL